MLSSLSSAEQILAIHEHLKAQQKALEKETPHYYSQLSRKPTLIDKNPPVFSQRLPKHIKKNVHMVMESSKREANLISKHAHRVLRQFQIQRVQLSSQRGSKKSPTNIFISPQSKEGVALKLKYPVFIGEHGELVAIMKTQKQQLGEGNYGSVYLGMDLDSHKFIAIKYHDLNKSSKDEILSEKNVMADIGRLAASIEVESGIITADELAWGDDYTQVLVDRSNNALTLDEIVYRLDMSIKLMLQVKRLNDSGYLSRDVKLDNMMWDPLTKKATLIDFGFSKKGKRIICDTVDGTPIYMAPEVAYGESSLSSDAYACGVALLEIFTTSNLFDHIDEWMQMFDECDAMSANTQFTCFFKKAAPDLLDNPNLSKELSLIVDVAKNLIRPTKGERITLEEAIESLNEYYHQMMLVLFKEKFQKIIPLSLTMDEINNPLIVQYLFEKLVKSNKEITLDSNCQLILMDRAAIEHHLPAFEALLKSTKVFEASHHGYSQLVLKHLVQNAFKLNNFDLFFAYIKEALNKGKLNQTMLDLQNIFKGIRATVASSREHKKLLLKLEKFESSIMPMLLNQAFAKIGEDQANEYIIDEIAKKVARLRFAGAPKQENNKGAEIDSQNHQARHRATRNSSYR
ncbi:MAG: protein kinase [Candidatus Berkiella sp.]